MTYRGENSIAQTTQVWDGGKWVPLNGLLFTDVLSAIASTIWKGPGGELGFSGAEDMISGQSAAPDNQSAAAGVQYVERKIRVAIDAPTGVQGLVNYDLPIPVYGVSPAAVAGSLNRTQLTAEVEVAFNRLDGSAEGFTKYNMSWGWTDDGVGYVVLTSTPAASPPLATEASTDGGAPAAPRIVFSQGDASDAVRYFAEIKLTLILSTP